MRRLLLIRHARTDADRRAAFPLDEPLDERGLDAVAWSDCRLGRGEALCSPARRARQTAEALGLEPQAVAELDECDFGRWAGRTLAEISRECPQDVRAWMTDPNAAPHGGESLSRFLDRVGSWLDAQRRLDGRAIAVTHGGVIKAAVVRALGAPPAAFWRIDVTPLAVTELHSRPEGWTLSRANATVGVHLTPSGGTA
jgi:broad specificity phosphatase PhoE